MKAAIAPAVSVVLPVYNCPHYVGGAIESVLAQTFADFELIVIDDGSQDETLAVLRRYNDPRIRLVTQANRGLAATLNRGIGLALGRYIARQDQDDISLPERFTKQVAYLEAHSNCALVGTWAEIWREEARTERAHRHPGENLTLKFELLFNNPFVHSSVMIRKSALERVGAYSTDRSRQPPEDYELWSRIAREYEVANVPEVLHIYREVEGSMSRDGLSPFLNHLVTICTENIASASGADSSDPHVANIAALAHGAEHRVQGKPDFSAMRRILRLAVQGVAAGADRERFASEADRRIDMLRYRLLQRSYPKGWPRRLIDLAARAARKILRA